MNAKVVHVCVLCNILLINWLMDGMSQFHDCLRDIEFQKFYQLCISTVLISIALQEICGTISIVPRHIPIHSQASLRLARTVLTLSQCIDLSLEHPINPSSMMIAL